MATYKAEFLAHHWAGRPWRRPPLRFTLGWLPLLAGAVRRMRLACMANTLSHAPGLHRAGARAAGVEAREVPLFAGESLQRWHTLRRTVNQLAGHLRAGGYVAGLEPSCTAVFRSDAAELFPDDQDLLRLRNHTVTLAELLRGERGPGRAAGGCG